MKYFRILYTKIKKSCKKKAASQFNLNRGFSRILQISRLFGTLRIQCPLLCIEFSRLLSESGFTGLEDLQDYEALLIETILYRITQIFY